MRSWAFCSTAFRQLALPSLRLVAVCLLPSEARAAAESPKATERGIPFTEVRQIQQVTPEALARNREVHLTGVITYHDAKENLTFLQDITGGIQLSHSPTNAAIAAGALVQLDGEIVQTETKRSVVPRRVRVVGSGVFPRPARTPHFRLMESGLDAQWIETTGVVREVSESTDKLFLRLSIRGGQLTAVVHQPAGWQRNRTVDVSLRLAGVASVSYDPQRKQNDIRLLVPDGSQISLITPPADSPFNLPFRTITNLLLTADASFEPFHRSRFRGVITAIFPGREIYLHDGSGSIRIAHPDAAPFEVGEVVDVVAYPQFNAQTLELGDALFQRTGQQQAVLTIDLSPAQAARRNRDGELVRVHGRLVGYATQRAQTILWLQGQGYVFGGVIPHTHPSREPSLKRGSLVELTGICSSLTTDPIQGQSFQIMLRTENDLQVIEPPNFWNVRNTVGVLGLMGLATFMAMTWIVTLRRQLRIQTERVRQNEEHLRFAIEAAEMGTWEYLPPAGQFYWRDATPEAEATRPPQSGSTLETLFEHVHPLDRTRVRDTIMGARQAGGTFQLEYRIGSGEGASQWRFMQGHGFCDLTGKVIRMIGVIQDVTHRKRTERALQEREEIYRAMFEKNRAVKLLIDPSTGHLVDANLAAADFYGYALEELKSMKLQDLTPLPEARTLQLLQQARSGENDLFHLAQCLHNGSRREVEICAGMLNVGGRSLLFCIILDVSEQVRATEAMRRLNEALESRVQDRTEELQKRVAEVEELNSNMISLLEDLKAAHLEAAQSARQTEEANRQLQAINQELEAFSYSVSHDLRAPLRHIAGYVSILGESHSQQLDAEGRRYLNTIENAAKRMGQLIDDLLAFSRIGRAQLSVRHFYLGQMVKEIIRELRPEQENRQVEWRIHELPRVEGDPSLIRQVLYNLIENALKYSRPRARSVIEVGILPELPDSSERVFFVKDNGVGFDMSYAEKLFGVFQRLHSTSQFEGTGIGLANVRRIILRHGGRSWAEAQPDAGACFFFSLPKRPPELKSEPESQTVRE